MSETILIVLGAIGFLAAGTGLGYGLARLRARGESAKASEVQQQFDDYRQEVSQHFGRTAEHFKAIGREYRELYEHMASGADSLCDREAVDVKLSFAPRAILESIAKEQEPPAPRDFADDEPQAAEAPADAETQIEVEAEPEKEREAEQALGAESDTEIGEKAERTLH
jgi:uncharacterized membrane-anchored protein YhcB (DUF1043 family)